MTAARRGDSPAAIADQLAHRARSAGIPVAVEVAVNLVDERVVLEQVIARADLGALGAIVRATFERLRELDKHSPAEVDRVVRAIVEHVRSWRPESVVSLSEWEPTEEPPTSPPLRGSESEPRSSDWRGTGPGRSTP